MLLVVFACGGRIAVEEGPALAPIPEDQFVHAWTTAHCNAIEPCCVLAGYKRASATCTEVWKASLATEIKAARSANAVYDGAAAAVCVNALQAVARSCPTGKQFAWTKLEACDRVYAHGTTPVGAHCETRWECAPGANERAKCESSVTPDGQQISACLSFRYEEGGLGAACSYETPPHESPYWHSCQPRLNCVASRCTPLPGRGEACSSVMGDDCDIGSVCRIDTRTCGAPIPVGGTCISLYECETYECRNGRCAPTARLFNEKTCE